MQCSNQCPENTYNLSRQRSMILAHSMDKNTHRLVKRLSNVISRFDGYTRHTHPKIKNRLVRKSNTAHYPSHSHPGEPRMGILSRVQMQLTMELLTDWRAKDRPNE